MLVCVGYLQHWEAYHGIASPLLLIPPEKREFDRNRWCCHDAQYFAVRHSFPAREYCVCKGGEIEQA